MDLYLTFRSFLKDRGCEHEFEEALGSQFPGYRLDANLWDILGGDEFFLGRIFDWTMTAQGRDYWAQIDSEWYDLAMNTLKNNRS